MPSSQAGVGSSTTAIAAPQLLLQTKLYLPPPADNLISREQLLRYLSQSMPRKLTLITASAGYGKTTIAAQWLQQLAAPVAWLSLDEHDDELLPFLRYLVAAIRTACPDVGETILPALHGTQSPNWQQLADSLIHELTHIPQPLYLTLDDYHVITADAIHQVLNRLLEHLPPTVHLILLSRTEPPLALGRLRVRRQMQELRAADLAFSLQDTAHFMTQLVGRELRPETLQTLHVSSEGWVAGLQLTALSLPRGTNAAESVEETALLRHFQGNHAYHIDYLFEEILALQPPAIQTFLLQTAILERFCAPLCEALLDVAWLAQIEEDAQGPGSIAESQAPIQAIFSWLRRANLFLIPLDSEGVWYRYHHLFQQMLQQTLRGRMSAAQIATLHRRASAWLAAEGVIESAIHHALAANDVETAAQLVEQHIQPLLNRERFATLRQLLHWLPPELIHQRPALLLAQICLMAAQKLDSEIFELLNTVERLLHRANGQDETPIQRALWGGWAVLSCTYWSWRGDAERSLSLALQGLKQLPESHQYLRGLAYLYMSTAYLLKGEAKQAAQKVRAVLGDVQSQPAAVRSRLWLALCLNYLVTAEWYQLVATTHQMLKEAERNDQQVNIGWARYLLGLVYYEWNQLDDADEHFSTVVRMGYQVRIDTLIMGYFGQALVYQARGQPDQANTCIDTLLDRLQQDDNRVFLLEIAAFRARLALLQGGLETATSWTRTVEVSWPGGPVPYLEMPLITRTQILVAQNTPTSLQQANDLVRQGLAVVQPIHHHWRTLELLALQALVVAGLDQAEAALSTLERSLNLAAYGGFVRTFVDLGPPMAELLERLQRRRTLPEPLRTYVQSLLTAFPPTTEYTLARPFPSAIRATQTMQPSQPAPPQPRSPVTKLAEPLTDREREILVLLAERLSNKEIAQLLAVSPFTVKNHLSTIYQKLGVSGRRQAVKRAEHVGLLH